MKLNFIKENVYDWNFPRYTDVLYLCRGQVIVVILVYVCSVVLIFVAGTSKPSNSNNSGLTVSVTDVNMLINIQFQFVR